MSGSAVFVESCTVWMASCKASWNRPVYEVLVGVRGSHGWFVDPSVSDVFERSLAVAESLVENEPRMPSISYSPECQRRSK